MTKQWQELKTTITEMRDNGGTCTQQEVCKFLANYMEVLEKQMQQSCEDCNSKWIPVTERLPENTEYVLAFDGEDYFVAWYEVQNIEMQGWHSWDKSFDRYYSIKAWMPIESYTEAEDE